MTTDVQDALANLADNLAYVANEIDGKWCAQDRSWKRGDEFLKVSEHLGELLSAANLGRAALEIEIDRGPDFCSRFKLLLGGLVDECEQIERLRTQRDYFRWMRESPTDAAARFPDAVRFAAEWLKALTQQNKKLQNGYSDKVFPTEQNLLDLWHKLHDEQGSGKADTQIAREFSSENGMAYLQRLKTARSRGEISDWKAR